MMPASTLSLRGYIINETRSQTTNRDVSEIKFLVTQDHPKNEYHQIHNEMSKNLRKSIFDLIYTHHTFKNPDFRYPIRH